MAAILCIAALLCIASVLDNLQYGVSLVAVVAVFVDDRVRHLAAGDGAHSAHLALRHDDVIVICRRGGRRLPWKRNSQATQLQIKKTPQGREADGWLLTQSAHIGPD